MNQQFGELLGALRDELDLIPKTMRQDPLSRQVILSLLYNAVKGMGLIPVPAWKPPLSTRDRVDLVGVAPDTDPPQIEMAFAVDPLVELPKLKALEWVQCPQKIVITYSERKDKVDQSSFFLSKDHVHLNLYD